MAKVAFSKLNKIKNLAPITFQMGENVNIEIEQYLPLAEKVELMTRVIEQSGNGEEGFFNIVKLDAYYRIEMVKAYTNISFTEKQLEDPTKLFDALVLNDIWAFIEDKIPQTERDYIWSNILTLAREITNYNHSAMGIFRSMMNINFLTDTKVEVEKLQDEVEKLKESPLVQQILPLIGQ